MRWQSKLTHYAHLMRWHKPIGIYLCLWPSLWALWLATDGHPGATLVSIIIAGSIVVRSAGCVINDTWDRDVDKHVERTKSRPITSGQVSVKEAIFLFGFLGILAFGLVLLLGTLATVVAVIAGLLTMLYPLAKRVTYFPQVVLGITFNAGILIAYAATQHALPMTAWVLYIAAILWTVAYDTMYAMADKQDDIALGLKSTAIKFSKNSAFIIGLLQALMLFGLCSIGYYSHFLSLYYAGLLCAALLFSYQHFLLLQRQPCYYTKAFLNNHWVGFIIFLVIFLQTW